MGNSYHQHIEISTKLMQVYLPMLTKRTTKRRAFAILYHKHCQLGKCSLKVRFALQDIFFIVSMQIYYSKGGGVDIM